MHTSCWHHRRQQEQHEHVQYLEELSTDQIEKAKHELTVARQAEILQNFATEINPDDTVDLMSKQLQEKELLMRHMVNEQNKLKQQLADKEQQHADHLRNAEDVRVFVIPIHVYQAKELTLYHIFAEVLTSVFLSSINMASNLWTANCSE
eukprot:scpid104563/ scgid0532/ 